MKPIKEITLANGAIKRVYAREDNKRSKLLSTITQRWNAPIGFKTKLRATITRQGSHKAGSVKIIKA